LGRGEVIVCRTNAPWESQQVQEPCILPNPNKDGILPGLRLATSGDGKTWRRHFNEKDQRAMGQIFPSTPGAYYEWHQAFKVGGTYVLSIEVGVSAGKRWRSVIAVSQHPDTGWAQIDVDALLQTKWEGLYADDTIYHVATTHWCWRRRTSRAWRRSRRRPDRARGN